MQVLAEGLRHAFDDLRARRPETMVSGDEPEVTALMEARLNRLLDEKVVWTGLVIACGGAWTGEQQLRWIPLGKAS